MGEGPGVRVRIAATGNDRHSTGRGLHRPGLVSSHCRKRALSAPSATFGVIQFHQRDSPSAITSPFPALPLATKPSLAAPTPAALTITWPRAGSVTTIGEPRKNRNVFT